jgi:hypothetical protein
MVRTDSGTYLGAFVSAGLLCLVAALMAVFVGRKPAEPVLRPLPA